MFESGGKPKPRNSGFLQRMLHECESREGKNSVPSAIEKRIKWVEQQQEEKRQSQASGQAAPAQQVASQTAPAQAGTQGCINHLAAYSAICTRIENLGVYDMPGNVRGELDKIVSEIRELMKYC